MKASRSLTVLAALCIGMFLGSCRTVEFWKENITGVVKTQFRNANKIHRSLDRHFLNYDWDDPYLDE